MSKIVKVIGREIIDSRGNPTVEAEVHLKAVSSAWLLRRQVLLPVPAKRWNCVTVTSLVSWVKAY